MGLIARTVEDCATFLWATLVPALWNGSLDLPQLPFDENAYNTTSQSRACGLDTLRQMIGLNPVLLRNVLCKKPVKGWRNVVILVYHLSHPQMVGQIAAC